MSVVSYNYKYNAQFNLDFFTQSSLRTFQSKNFLQNIVKQTTDTRKNLGTFSNQHPDQKLQKEISQLIHLNGINQNNYTFVSSCKEYCIGILSQLLGGDELLCGQDTTGSSEAILLAIYSLLQLWRSKQNTQHEIYKPEIILGENAHNHIFTIAKMLGIRVVTVPCNSNLFSINPSRIYPLLNPQVIGVIVTAGNTYTGEVDDIEGVNSVLDRYQRVSCIDIPIHVDAASGGFILPFVKQQNLWNFALSHVYTMNVSSHKFGFTYPSLGWYFSKQSFHSQHNIKTSVEYLHGSLNVGSIHFSRPIHNLILQKYNFIKYGADGYTKLVDELTRLKECLVTALGNIGGINLLNINSTVLPVVVFSYENGGVDFLTNKLFQKGWSIPTYSIPTLPEKIGRIVIRQGFDEELLDKLVGDIVYIINEKE